MRVKEWSERPPEPVTDHVIRVLEREVQTAYEREWKKYGPEGTNTIRFGEPRGTEYVRVRAFTLQELLRCYRTCQQKEN